MIHEIKLNREFCEDVYNGTKQFEIRKNDRQYEVGDIIKFIPWEPRSEISFKHPIKQNAYIIKYILHGGYGLKDGYIAMQIKRIGRDNCATNL